MINWIVLCAAVPVALFGYIRRRSINHRLRNELAHTASAEGAGSKQAPAGESKHVKKLKRIKMLNTILLVISIYAFLTQLITVIFGEHESGGFEFSLWAERITIKGVSISETVVYTWLAMAILIIAALALRITVVRSFSKYPEGLQNALEMAVETVRKYTRAQAKGTGELLCSYILGRT